MGSADDSSRLFDRRAWWWLLFALAGIASVTNFVRYSEVVFDDAFITYRYSQNLAEGHGLVFNPGERVLGTTAPLYALILGALGWLGLDIPTASGVLFCLGLATIALAGAVLLRDARLGGAGLLFAAIVLADFGRVFFLFGLETPVFGALLFVTLLCFARDREIGSGMALGLAILTRYDAVVFAAVLLVVTMAERLMSAGMAEDSTTDPRRPGWTAVLPIRAVLVATSIVLPWLVFSWFYYGRLTPNTLAAKSGATGAADYLLDAARNQGRHALEFLSSQPLAWPPGMVSVLLLFLVCCWFAGFFPLLLRRPRLLVAAIYPFLLWLAYAAIGAPVEHTWHLLPASWMLLLIALGALQIVLELPFRRWRAQWRPGENGLLLHIPLLRARVSASLAGSFLALLAVLVGCLPIAIARTNPLSDVSNSEERRAREGAYREIAHFLVTRDLGDLRVLTHEPGYLAFLSRNPMIDAAGLVTPGLYFHDVERRLDFPELVAATHPDLVVPTGGQSPEFEIPGYVPILWTFNTRQLLMRQDLVAQHFESLMTPVNHGGSVPGQDSAGLSLWQSVWPGSELATDMIRGTRSRWKKRGGFLRSTVDPSTENPQWNSDSVGQARPLGGIGGLESPAVLVDFDEIELRFAASEPAFQSAQLIVEGRLVLEEKGERGDLAHLREARWSTGSWRGQAARVRLPNLSWTRPVVVDWIRTVSYRQRRLLEDFEADDLDPRRWSGFDGTTTALSAIASRHGLGVASGRRAATSFGMPGNQQLASVALRLDLPSLSFLVLDFCGRDCEVRLETVADDVVQRRIRGRNSNQLRSVIWDMPELLGREVRLVVSDRAAARDEFFGVDDVVAFER